MAIAFVGAVATDSASGVSTLPATYAPTAGNVVCVGLTTSGAVTAITVKDSAGNLLTAGPSVTFGVTSLGVNTFFYTASAGVTAFTPAWTTGRQCSFGVAEYSGVGVVNSALAGNTALGTSTAVSIAVTTEDNNDWVFAGVASGVQTATIVTGNDRAQSVLSTARIALADNTVITAGPVTVSGTLLSSVGWGIALLELRLAAVVATKLYNQLTMTGCGR